MGELWSEALEEIKDRVGKQNFDTWIKPVRFITKNKNEVTLEVPNKFFRDWLTENYIGQIENILATFAKQDIKIVFSVNQKLAARSTVEKIPK
jgi:chromosomal replication initiator protein